MAGAAEEVVDEFIPEESLQAGLEFHRGPFLDLGRDRRLEGQQLALIGIIFNTVAGLALDTSF